SGRERKFRLTRVTRILQLSVFTKIALAVVGAAPRRFLRGASSLSSGNERIDARPETCAGGPPASRVPAIGLLCPVILSGLLDFPTAFQIVTGTPLYFPCSLQGSLRSPTP